MSADSTTSLREAVYNVEPHRYSDPDLLSLSTLKHDKVDMKPPATGKISPTACQEDPGSHHHQLPDTQPPSTRVGTLEKDNQEKWRLESNWRKQLANAHEPSSPMSPDLLGGLVSPSSEASQLRRKTRPSPIHVPPSPSNLKESGPATTSHLPSTAGGRRRRGSDAPKSAAANFAKLRGISTATVRTTLPLSANGQPSSASSNPKLASAKLAQAIEMPPENSNLYQSGASRRASLASMLGSAAVTHGGLLSAGLKSSTSVEVDFLRGEMEKAMKLAAGGGGGTEEAKNEEVVRNDIILCKFYHTPGLTCTARPCRFIHEFSPLATPLSANFVRRSSMPLTSDGLERSTHGKSEPQQVHEELVEIIEHLPMSGGGAGPGSKYSKNKYKTVNCRDWDKTGSCPYGEYCSFIHRGSNGEKDSLAQTLAQGASTPTMSGGRNTPRAPDESVSHSTSDQGAQHTTPTGPTKSTTNTTTRPKSFNGSNLVIPDLRWTADQGMTVENPSTATKPDFKSAAASLAEAISSADHSSPALVTPTQYASVPMLSAWGVRPPHSLVGQRNPDAAVGGGIQGTSPHLPITAYTFSTDSTPPMTPENDGSDGGASDETTTELHQQHEQEPPTVGQAHVCSQSDEPALPPQNPSSSYDLSYPSLSSGVTGSLERQKTIPSSSLPLPYIRPSVHDMGMYPWPIESVYPQAMTNTWDAILKNPSLAENGHPEEHVRRLASQRLARLAKESLPPQEIQAKTNYRTKPCKFYATGDCPRGDQCTFLHDVSNKGITMPSIKEAKNIKAFKTEPCKFFNTAEGCKEGADCAFLHVNVMPFGAPLMLRPRPWRTRPCRHFQNGTCLAGDQCHFAHTIDNSPPMAKSTAQRRKPCARFGTEAGCKLGNQCRYAHNYNNMSTESQPSEERPETVTVAV